MIIFLLLLFAVYSVVMVFFAIAFKKLPVYTLQNVIPASRFSIIIPFRNEAENLRALLQSLRKLEYPNHLFEILLVNDASEDNSEEIILEKKASIAASLNIIQNKRKSASPKKDAITEGIKFSRYEWIVTTDADCVVAKDWLKIMDDYIQEVAKNKTSVLMLCGPVLYQWHHRFLEYFQFLDALSLQGITIGSFGLHKPFLNNGANLAYKKEVFKEVQGFLGNDHIASGDDIFLLEKIYARHPSSVHFLKNRAATVTTRPQKDLRSLINQRVRWISKTSKQKQPYPKMLGALVLVTNVLFLFIPIFIIISPVNWMFLTALFLLKMGVDLLVIGVTATFFQKKIFNIYYFPTAFLYPAITLMVALKSFSGKYNWKGRKFKKHAV